MNNTTDKKICKVAQSTRDHGIRHLYMIEINAPLEWIREKMKEIQGFNLIG